MIVSPDDNDIATLRELFGRVFENFMAVGDASPLRASRQQALLELGDKLWHYRSVEYAVPFQVPDRSMAPRSVP